MPTTDVDPVVEVERPALRVTQMDVASLDTCYVSTIMAAVKSFLESLPPKAAVFLQRFEPEMKLVVRSALCTGALFKTGATFGQQFLNIKYNAAWFRANMKSRYYIYYILTCLMPYLTQRLPTIAQFVAINQISSERRVQLERMMERMEHICQLLDIIHFLLFLRGGGTRSLAERLAGLTPVHIKPPQMGSIDYTWQNRELLWHTFADIIMFILPVINIKRLRSMLMRYVKKKRVERAGGLPSLQHSAHRPLQCPICKRYCVIPTISTCKHSFCYSCIRELLADDENATCPKCDATLSFDRINIYFKPAISA